MIQATKLHILGFMLVQSRIMLGIYTEGYSSKGFEKSMIAQYFVLFKIIRNMIRKRVKNNQMEKKISNDPFSF